MYDELNPAPEDIIALELAGDDEVTDAIVREADEIVADPVKYAALQARIYGAVPVRHTPAEVYGRCTIEGPHPRRTCALFNAEASDGPTA